MVIHLIISDLWGQFDWYLRTTYLKRITISRLSLSRVTRNFAKFAVAFVRTPFAFSYLLLLTVTWWYGVIESGCTHRLRTYVVGSDDDWTELNNPGQFAIHRGYMSGASRAQNSIGESCANASFFGRTSSPIREKTRVAHRLPAHPSQYNCICAGILSSVKDHGVKLSLHRNLYMKIIPIDLQITDPRVRLEKEILLSLMLHEMFCNNYFRIDI